jgi:hypothetical protein
VILLATALCRHRNVNTSLRSTNIQRAYYETRLAVHRLVSPLHLLELLDNPKQADVSVEDQLEELLHAQGLRQLGRRWPRSGGPRTN